MFVVTIYSTYLEFNNAVKRTCLRTHIFQFIRNELHWQRGDLKHFSSLLRLLQRIKFRFDEI